MAESWIGSVQQLEAENARMRRVIADVFVAVAVDPTVDATGPVRVVEYYDTPELVRAVVRERNRLRALVKEADLIAGQCQNCIDDWLRAQDRVNDVPKFGAPKLKGGESSEGSPS